MWRARRRGGEGTNLHAEADRISGHIAMKTRQEYNAYALAWYHRNKAKISSRRAAYYALNREKMTAISRNHRCRRLYGVSMEEYDRRLAQPCAICGRSSTVLDHDHNTGKARSGLCNKCNWGLGHFNDNPALLLSAINYLESVIV
jgi:hypothetical protein